MATISRLERVPLREVWTHEAYDFTLWLQENIDVLNEALNLNLVNVERERAAGSFSVDLVAEDEAGSKVIIENQLEKSNHDHLGKVITYFTAMEARAAIWIVAEPRPEHVAALAWLNESSSGRFYLVKVEAIRISQSPPAPLLTLIVGPSAEAEEISRSKREYAGRDDLRQRWWSLLLSRPDAKLHAHLNPKTSNWLGASAGIPEVSFGYMVYKETCSVLLWIDRRNRIEGENKYIFDQLLAKRAEIDQEMTFPISWDRLDGRRECQLKITIQGGFAAPEEEWGAIQDQLVAAMNQLEAALRPHLRDVKILSGT